MLQHFNPRNRDIKINVNGQLIHRDQPAISVFDSVVQGGDGVWEGLRVYEGRVFRLHEHLARLRKSAAALAFEEVPDNDSMITEIRRTLKANDMYDGVHIRLTLTRGVKITSGMDPRLNRSGPTLIVAAEHKPPVYDKSGLRLIIAQTRRIPPECLDQKIHSNNLLNSILAKIEANAAGADDALMLDVRGYLAETNATHVFVVHDGCVMTSHTGSCPEGVTRAAVLALCPELEIPCTVRDITPDEIYDADEVFCTGTMGELAGVVEVDGRPVGGATVGPLTAQLSAAYGALTAREGVRLI